MNKFEKHSVHESRSYIFFGKVPSHHLFHLVKCRGIRKKRSSPMLSGFYHFITAGRAFTARCPWMPVIEWSRCRVSSSKAATFFTEWSHSFIYDSICA
jgi:hypothetical protein